MPIENILNGIADIERKIDAVSKYYCMSASKVNLGSSHTLTLPVSLGRCPVTSSGPKDIFVTLAVTALY